MRNMSVMPIKEHFHARNETVTRRRDRTTLKPGYVLRKDRAASPSARHRTVAAVEEALGASLRDAQSD
jgi:hypothetical protein